MAAPAMAISLYTIATESPFLYCGADRRGTYCLVSRIVVRGLGAEIEVGEVEQKKPETVGYPLEIRLFGPVQVLVDGEPLPRLRSRKGQWLLALLILRNGGEVDRRWLAGVLWPESVESKALYNLRRTLDDLRNALGRQADRLISPTPRTLAFDLDGVYVDVLDFDCAATAMESGALERAVELHRSVLLEACAEDWVCEEREQRNAAYRSALETLAREASRNRRHGDAVHLFQHNSILDSG